MGSRFLASLSSGNLSDFFSGKLNIIVATINGFKPSGLKYSGTSNSSIVSNTIGINGGSLLTSTGVGSENWAANEFQDNATYTIRQTGTITILDKFGSDGSLDLRVHMHNGSFSPSTISNAVTYSDIFPVTSSTNKRWMLETTLTRRGASILATSKFEYTSNGTTTLEGCIFGGNNVSLDFSQPIKIDIRAYPTAGTISLYSETMTITKL